MATNTVRVTLQIRSDQAADWLSRNPVLAEGEYGLENDTFLLKIGDGVRDWAHLPYLNKLDSDYFQLNNDGTITFSDSFMDIVETLQAAAGSAIEHLTITDTPVNDTDAANKKYVDDAIAAAGHLKRMVVQSLPSAESADPNTLYMVLALSGDHYEEYMVIDGTWDMVGSTGDGGSGGFTLEIATASRLGGVKSSTEPNTIAVNSETGIMTLNQVSTSLLYVPSGDTLILYGGNA
jgi:hypothetical protein